MIRSTRLLRQFVGGVAHLTGARSVSLFIPASPGDFSKPILIREGEGAPPPELSDVATAEEFHQSFEIRPLQGEGSSPAPRQFPSTSPHCCLICVPSATSFQSKERRAWDRSPPADLTPSVWIGLRFDDDRDRFTKTDALLPLPPRLAGRDEAREMWVWLVSLGEALGRHMQQISEILDDSVTGLPGRTEFEAELRRAMEKTRSNGRPLTLLLINPDDFSAVNERLGREVGDKTLRDIGSCLGSTLRRTDSVARYGGAIFACLLRNTDAEGARKVAEKVATNLTASALQSRSVHLGFSGGAATFDPEDTDIRQPADLVRRAEQALQVAKRGGGGRFAAWQRELESEEMGNLDRLRGIFTGYLAKDYRNMALLSDTVSVVAASTDFEGLAAQTVNMLYSILKPERLGLFDWPHRGAPRLIKGRTKETDETGASTSVETLELDERQLALLEEARRQEGVSDVRFAASESGCAHEVLSYAVALVANDRCLGCLYLEGRVGHLAFDSSDLVFIQALASQLAVAFDRARLAAREKRRQERERQRLLAEAYGLRHAVQQAKLVYRSKEMEAVLATVRRLGPTDATVLITGESGTGKELLARTFHELSPRRTKPFVVVDCSAIPPTLIESELFGYEKGAYTGAQRNKVGRLVDADGGTVVFDEIGELPLEVQSKLLRFVAEKQIIPVGGNRVRRIDVRVIAMTNRDLAVEAAAGRFREDLYYRLNVAHLTLPPLQSRVADILYLADYFLKKFIVQYQKGNIRFTREAEELMLEHPWPGNVRDLQNRIMQAVILCEGDEIGAEGLGLKTTSAPEWAETARRVAAGGGPKRLSPESGPREETDQPTPDDAWQALRLAVGRQIEEAVNGEAPIAAAMGKWLSEDVVIEAYGAANGVLRRGAAILGIPEATFRRKCRKAMARAEAGLSPRLASRERVRPLIARLVRLGHPSGGDILERARRLLLEEVTSRVADNAALGSAIMGVTESTYRRWAGQARFFEHHDDDDAIDGHGGREAPS